MNPDPLDIQERKKVIKITYWQKWQKDVICDHCSWWDELDPVTGVGVCWSMVLGAQIKNSGKELTYKFDKCLVPFLAKKGPDDC